MLLCAVTLNKDDSYVLERKWEGVEEGRGKSKGHETSGISQEVIWQP